MQIIAGYLWIRIHHTSSNGFLKNKKGGRDTSQEEGFVLHMCMRGTRRSQPLVQLNSCFTSILCVKVIWFFRKQLGPHQGSSPIQQPFQNCPPNPDGDLLPQKVPAKGDRFRDRVWRLRTRCNRQYVEDYVFIRSFWQGKSRKDNLLLQKCAPSCTRSKLFWIRGRKGGTLCTLLNTQATKTLSCQRYIYRNFCNI